MEQASQTGAAASGSGQDVKETLRSVAEAVKEQTHEAAGDVRDKTADKIKGMTRAVHGAANELGQQVPQLASYIHAAANRVDGAAQALRDPSVEEMTTSFVAFARRQPTAAFALSALAGFALTGFLKSSAN